MRYMDHLKFCCCQSWIDCCLGKGAVLSDGTVYNRWFSVIFQYRDCGQAVFLGVMHWTRGNYIHLSLQITEALLKERDKQAKWNGIPLLLQKLYEHSHPNSDFSQCQSILKVLSAVFSWNGVGFFVVTFSKDWYDDILWLLKVCAW